MSLIRQLLILFILVSGSFSGSAQIRVTGGFIGDSVKIGQEVGFFVAARYPSDQVILLPDSTAKFFPFEFVRKRYFETQTEEGISRDSVIYYVSTYEIDKYQGLSLPVFLLNAQDCTAYQTNADSIMLAEVAAKAPDSVNINDLPLRESIAYHEVKYQINWLIVTVASAAVLFVTLAVWVLFGKRISRHFKIRRLTRMHNQFMLAYSRTIEEVNNAFSQQRTEHALASWKRYMENLESRPYTKLTTAETIRLYHDESLGQNLRKVDRAIYGHDTSVTSALQELKTVADRHFAQKIQEVKSGK